MTEAEWLACTDPRVMVGFLEDKVSDRKWRLFACAYCRTLLWDLLPDAGVRHAIAVSEAYADGQVPESALETQMSILRAVARGAVGRVAKVPYVPDYVPDAAKSREERELDALEWAEWAVRIPESGFWIAESEEERKHQCALLRDLLGNPFRLVTVDPGWLTREGNSVLKLARAIYDEGRFDQMPVLADALEDAGSLNADLHAHMRGPGPHVRGCWAVDLLLGKE